MIRGEKLADWCPEKYARFTGQRLRPALDLLRALPNLPNGPVIDLGCGSGAVGPALAALGRDITGIDNSPAMLEKAAITGAYAHISLSDISIWSPETPPALIFSNAALHWLPDHETLLPRLAAMLAPAGTLAVQLPAMNDAPSHATWLTLARRMFGFAPDDTPGILGPAQYHALLSPLGQLHLWQTEYFQILPESESGHPVRNFTESTFAKPVLDALAPDKRAALITAYDAAMETHYPRLQDGSVVFPFRRLFFTLSR